MVGSVIGISLGTRIAGIAVVKRRELVIYQVKTFKGSWSKKKEAEILKSFDALFDLYRVKCMAVKIVSPLHTSKAVDGLIQALKSKAEMKGIKVICYQLKDVKKILNLSRRQNLGEYVTSKFPELTREFEKEQGSFNSYYSRMFEAVAIARIVEGKVMRY